MNTDHPPAQNDFGEEPTVSEASVVQTMVARPSSSKAQQDYESEVICSSTVYCRCNRLSQRFIFPRAAKRSLKVLMDILDHRYSGMDQETKLAFHQDIAALSALLGVLNHGN